MRLARSRFDGLSRGAHASVLASPAKWGSGGQQAPSGSAAALAAGAPLTASQAEQGARGASSGPEGPEKGVEKVEVELSGVESLRQEVGDLQGHTEELAERARHMQKDFKDTTRAIRVELIQLTELTVGCLSKVKDIPGDLEGLRREVAALGERSPPAQASAPPSESSVQEWAGGSSDVTGTMSTMDFKQELDDVVETLRGEMREMKERLEAGITEQASSLQLELQRTSLSINEEIKRLANQVSTKDNKAADSDGAAADYLRAEVASLREDSQELGQVVHTLREEMREMKELLEAGTTERVSSLQLELRQSCSSVNEDSMQEIGQVGHTPREEMRDMKELLEAGTAERASLLQLELRHSCASVNEEIKRMANQMGRQAEQGTRGLLQDTEKALRRERALRAEAVAAHEARVGELSRAHDNAIRAKSGECSEVVAQLDAQLGELRREAQAELQEARQQLCDSDKARRQQAEQLEGDLLAAKEALEGERQCAAGMEEEGRRALDDLRVEAEERALEAAERAEQTQVRIAAEAAEAQRDCEEAELDWQRRLADAQGSLRNSEEALRRERELREEAAVAHETGVGDLSRACDQAIRAKSAECSEVLARCDEELQQAQRETLKAERQRAQAEEAWRETLAEAEERFGQECQEAAKAQAKKDAHLARLVKAHAYEVSQKALEHAEAVAERDPIISCLQHDVQQARTPGEHLTTEIHEAREEELRRQQAELKWQCQLADTRGSLQDSGDAPRRAREQCAETAAAHETGVGELTRAHGDAIKAKDAECSEALALRDAEVERAQQESLEAERRRVQADEAWQQKLSLAEPAGAPQHFLSTLPCGRAPAGAS